MDCELKLIGKRQGLVIRDCLAKLKHFCAHDAFQHYDLIGYQYAAESERFQKQLLSATNKAMLARTPRKAWAIFLDKPLFVLANIPVDVDLVESSDGDYAVARERLHACYLTLTKVNYITDMAASKMLYLKRPRLVAISDSYVREALAIRNPDTNHYPGRAFYAARALNVSDSVRAVGKANLETLNYVQKELSPLTVSKVRIIDILIWVDMAIDSGHPNWSRAAKEKGWFSIGWNL